MYDNQEIRQQLEKILESPSFRSSTLLSSFLKYVVEQTIEGNGDNIKGYNIAVDAFNREVDFDAQKDTIVRITAGKLRKELDAYYTSQGTSDSIRIKIPKGTYKPVIETKNNTLHTDSQPERTFHMKRFYIWGFILFLAMIGFGLFIFFSPREISGDKPIILFFEIENISVDPENDIWAHGITEDIVVLSSRFSELEFYGPIKSEEELDVNMLDHVEFLFSLHGSVKKSDSLFILNVRLNNYKTGEVLWSESFNRKINSESLIDVEYQICNNVAKKIASIYGVVHNEVIRNSSASNPKLLSSYKSVLMYYKYLEELSYDAFLLTKDALSQTVKEDPDYAVAWSALGSLCMDEYLHFGGDSVESFNKAHQYNSRALKLDPNNVLVQHNRVFISYMSHQLDDFKRAVSKVQSLNPTSIMTGENGLFLVYLGESKRGLEMIAQAEKYAITYPGYFHIGPFIDFYRRGEYNKALYEACQVQMPEHYGDPLSRAVALVNLDRMDEAIEAKYELLQIKPDFELNGAKLLSKTLYSKKDVDALMSDLSKIKSK